MRFGFEGLIRLFSLLGLPTFLRSLESNVDEQDITTMRIALMMDAVNTCETSVNYLNGATSQNIAIFKC
jgi:hypothetical protein